MNLNKAFIVGRVTADPELRSTQSGQQVASFSVATNRVWYDANKQKQEAAEFHNIVVWGRQAEATNNFLKKGSLVLVEGRIQTRKWEDKTGNQRRSTEIVAERVQFGPRSAASQGGGSAPAEALKEPPVPTINVDDEQTGADDLPF